MTFPVMFGQTEHHRNVPSNWEYEWNDTYRCILENRWHRHDGRKFLFRPYKILLRRFQVEHLVWHRIHGTTRVGAVVGLHQDLMQNMSLFDVGCTVDALPYSEDDASG